jgi:hypothetical protein
MQAEKEYQGTYRDSRGTEAIVFSNDSTTLKTRIRGVKFSGRDFDFLCVEPSQSAEKLRQFSLYNGECLCDCIITADIPVPIIIAGKQAEKIVRMTLDLGPPREEKDRGISRENLLLTLVLDDEEISSSGTSGFFEDALQEIGKQLPKDTYFKSCINCLYSDYSVIGNGLFGTMMCFRNIKAEYLSAKSKHEWSDLEFKNKYDRRVQETYLCPEFTKRIPGTGYRG